MQQTLPCVTTLLQTKRCSKCHLDKEIAAFPKRHSGRLRTNSYCFECQRIYSRAHYQRNKSRHNARRRRNQTVYVAKNKELMRQYLKGQRCVDCGISNPLVLEFDHVRGVKRREVSIMLCSGFAWKRILEEIAKCEIRCANCHRVKTAGQFGWRGRRYDED